MDDIAIILAILDINNIGNKKAYNYILDNGFDTEKLLHNIEKFSGLTQNEFNRKIEVIKEKLKKYNKTDIEVITLLDNEYPKKLLKISDPILYLFYKGNIQLINDKSLAIIGTRKPSENAKNNARKAAKIFGEKGITIVSGLAVGCDTDAHIGGLEATSKNIAVLPCGLDDIYPKSNQHLASKIIENGGCIVSEYLPSTKISKYNFVKRDRIQSAISNALLVIEASNNSGTTNTVQEAIKQKKDVYKITYNGIEEKIFNFDLNDIDKITQLEHSITSNYNNSKDEKFKQISLWN